MTVAKLAILTALSVELQPFLDRLETRNTVEKTPLLYYTEGLFEGVRTALITCGIGKTNAALYTQFIIDTFVPDLIIVSGTAGGLRDELALGDIVVADAVSYHDLAESIITEFPPHSARFVPDSGMLNICKSVLREAKFGSFITGDVFVEGENRRELRERFKPLCADMETAAVAHTCLMNGLPFIAVRAISDTSDDEGFDEFMKNAAFASAKAAHAVSEIVARLRQSLG